MMPNPLSLTIMALATIVPTQLAAQAHPITAPRAYTGTMGGNSMGAPFGRTKYFGQTWYRGDTIPFAYPITGIGWRSAANQMSPGLSIRLEVVLDNTSAGMTQLSKTFASNLSAQPTTFYQMKNLNVPASVALPAPDIPNVWLPADQPLIFTGPHFIVQVDVQTTSTPTSTGFGLDGYLHPGNALNHHTVETSCGASALTSTFNSNTSAYELTATGAPPLNPVTFMVGVNNQSIAGAFLLPLDLTAFGLTKCVLGLEPLADATIVADPSGTARLSLPLTLPSGTLVVFAQAAHPSNANAAGIATTNVATSILGDNGLSTYLYNWSSFSNQAQYGPYPRNRGQIMLIR